MAGNWKAIGDSRYAWEKEALEFVRERLPEHEPYRAWSNFEFIADDGSVNEVDLLVFSPQGFFLIEIKSRAGILRGDASTWTWETDGRRHTDDNPLYGANLKAKKLASLLDRQKVVRKKGSLPFVEGIIFCSAPDLRCELEGTARTRVCLRDTEAQRDRPARPGIMAAIMRRECPGLGGTPRGQHDRPTAKLVAQALEQAGVHALRRDRKVADYLLEEPIGVGPGYQDWRAVHASIKSVRRRVRIYQVRSEANDEDRKTIERAAQREFQLLERLGHSGILQAQSFTEHTMGPALIYDYDPGAVRLDHYLIERKDILGIDVRLHLLRQVAEVMRFAHEHKVVHRSLSPQSILVTDVDKALPRIKVYNWQAGFRDAGSTSAGQTAFTITAHADRLVDDTSRVYMAPEALSDPDSAGEHLDVFSLGALAYHLLSGFPPAASSLELNEKLRETKGLQISSVLNGAGENLQWLVQFSTHPEVSSRLDSVADFLESLNDVEDELTAPSHESVEDPAQAGPGDILEGGYEVIRRLGQGACSTALLVKRGEEHYVLKVATTTDQSPRLRDEAEVLRKLHHAHIVELCAPHAIGEHAGFLMRPVFAEKDKLRIETLGQRLRKEGRLHIDLLQRFGDDLLSVLVYLEEQGILHRDIKPDNIAVGAVGRGSTLHVVLFDFSLARTPMDNVRAGTPGYLDPLLPRRKPPRWDLHAERYAAAMTLHELATGALPQWGDGKTDPSLLDGEITIEPELFDAGLREELTDFFARAFRRNPTERFDNAEQMLRAWRECFEGIEEPGTLTDVEDPEVLRERLSTATVDTQIHELGLGTRATNALDRANVLTVDDLLSFPVRQLQRLRGVGNKTRREILAAVRILHKHLDGQAAPKTTTVTTGTEGSDETIPVETMGIDLLAQRVTRPGSRENETTQRTLRALLGLLPEMDTRWPSQSEVALLVDVSRARIQQLVGKFQDRWGKDPGFTRLRADIVGMLEGAGGAMSVEELAETLLVARGSAQDEPERTRLAMAVARGAVEAERSKDEPRFILRRADDRALIALNAELAEYALRLGRTADKLAGEDPLVAPARVVERLRDLKPPREDLAIPEARLVRMAAAASHDACVSSRQELYPRRMDVLRALKLSQGALMGVLALSVEEVQARVRSRYPEAAPLPGHPELDELLKEAGLDLNWDSTVWEGRGAYISPGVASLSSVTSTGVVTRLATGLGASDGPGLTPDVANARQLDERLQRAAADGAFLALLVEPKRYEQAREELCRRFPVEVIDFEGLFIDALRETAERARVKWDLVVQTDAMTSGTDWDKLLLLVRRAIPAVEARLLAADKTILLVYSELIGRYEQMDLLERLRDRVGRKGGIPGLWLLLAGDAVAQMEGKAVPILAPAQKVRITRTWLENRHRAIHGPGEVIA